MARDFSGALQQAMEFYIAGQLVEARALLLDIVRADPRIEAGWMFLSYTLDEPGQKADCLRKVLALNPQNAEAKAALQELEGTLIAGATAEGLSPSSPAPARPPAASGTDAAGPSPKKNQEKAAPAQPATAELKHASPFTIDIGHAEDDFSAIPGEEASQTPPPAKFPDAVAGPSNTAAARDSRPPARQPPADWFPKSSEESAAETVPAPLVQRKLNTAPMPNQKPVQPPVPSAAATVSRKQPLAAAGDPEASQAVEKPTSTTPKPGQKPVQPPVPPAAATVSSKQPPLAAGGIVAQKPASAPGKKTGQLGPTRAPVPDWVKNTPPGSDETPSPPKRRSTGCTCLIAVLAVALIITAIGVVLWLTGYLPDLLNVGQNPNGAATSRIVDSPTPWSLPPRSTDTPTPSPSLTPTISSTPTYTLTPTLEPPDPTVEADMARLRKEVEDIRGLKIEGDIQAYVVDRSQAEAILQADLDRIGYRETIQNEARALVALGFIKPTYDLAKWATTRLADGVLGFYMPSSRIVYVIGNRFAGMERYTFSHEYDHALVHNAFPDSMSDYGDPLCTNDSQRCEAIRALVEGDAMLVMELWREQYATAYDERDINLSPSQLLMPPEQNTPDYMYPSMLFTYLGGEMFVYNLWKQGNWALVNKVYEDLPYSTEQILHPEKYLAGEKPVAMNIPDLADAVGSDWTLIKSDNLGEYMTYLLLAFGADLPAQLASETSADAAYGWGGDHYLVYESADEQLLLAAEWTWDSNMDATQFLAAFEDYLDKRFRGGAVEASAGKCWEMNESITCVYRSGKNVLWVSGPEMSLLDAVRDAYKVY